VSCRVNEEHWLSGYCSLSQITKENHKRKSQDVINLHLSAIPTSSHISPCGSTSLAIFIASEVAISWLAGDTARMIQFGCKSNKGGTPQIKNHSRFPQLTAVYHINLNISNQCPNSPTQHWHHPRHQRVPFRCTIGPYSQYQKLCSRIDRLKYTQSNSSDQFKEKVQFSRTLSQNKLHASSSGSRSAKYKGSMHVSKHIIQTKLESTRTKLFDGKRNILYQKHITYPRRSWSDPGDRSESGSPLHYNTLQLVQVLKDVSHSRNIPDPSPISTHCTHSHLRHWAKSMSLYHKRQATPANVHRRNFGQPKIGTLTYHSENKHSSGLAPERSVSTGQWSGQFHLKSLFSQQLHSTQSSWY